MLKCHINQYKNHPKTFSKSLTHKFKQFLIVKGTVFIQLRACCFRQQARVYFIVYVQKSERKNYSLSA